MTGNLKKAVAEGELGLDELEQAEASTKARLESLTAKIAELQAAYDNPGPSETRETLSRLRKDLDDAHDDARLAKGHFDRVVEARMRKESELAEAKNRQLRADLQRRLDRAIAEAPKRYHALAKELLTVVADLDQLDTEILAFNKSQPAGSGHDAFVSTFESSVRVTLSSDAPKRSTIVPARLSSVFEIPVLLPGDTHYRVPGTFPPVGIWLDPNGAARR